MLNDANKDYENEENENEYPNYEQHDDKEGYMEQKPQMTSDRENVDFNVQEPNEIKDKHHEEDLDQDHLNPNPDKLSNLITLNYISVCQYCKENFNSNNNLPYLLKCGHFFCKSCILNNFTSGQGQIRCPDDGSKASSLSELKVLNNLITGENNESANRPSINNYVDDTVSFIN